MSSLSIGKATTVLDGMVQRSGLRLLAVVFFIRPFFPMAHSGSAGGMSRALLNTCDETELRGH